MDVESIHSTNSHRSHNKTASKNNTDYALQSYQTYDSQLYGCSMNNNVYPDNIMPVYNTAFYPPNFRVQPNNFNQAPISTNFCFNNNQPTNNGYVPISMIPNNSYGDFQNIPEKPIHPDFNNMEKVQDDNWGADTCTAVTSDTGGSFENLTTNLTGMGNQISMKKQEMDCVRLVGNGVFIILYIISILSPIVMLIIPISKAVKYNNTWSPACEGQLISLTSKLLILIVGTWALFFRRKPYSVTRISFFRVFILLVAFAIVFCYWLFYLMNIFGNNALNLNELVTFSLSLVDTLLFVHYLALILLEVYQSQACFYIKVIRSPDGMSKFYRVGRSTIQSAAIHVLQNYVTDFPEYNYDLVQCLKRKCYKRYQARQNHHNSSNNTSCIDTPEKKTKYRLYNIDSDFSSMTENDKEISRNLISNTNSNSKSVKAGTGTSARLYEESEWDKKFRKRQMRLLIAVEEAFSHVHSFQFTEEEKLSHKLDDHLTNMGVLEAAQTILPAIIKPLQKLLRASRRHMNYSSSIVIAQIAKCLSYRLSPKYLVEQFSPAPFTVMDSMLLSSAKIREKVNNLPSQIHLSWIVICDKLLSTSIEENVTFQLKPRDCHIDDICLMCSVYKVPFLSLEEKLFNESECRFILQTNSETSV